MNRRFLFFLFFHLILNSKFFLNVNHLTLYNATNSCPKNYELAKLYSLELWNEGLSWTVKHLGKNKRVWIKQALNWTGSGVMQWMIATQTDPEKCIFPPSNLESFCVPNNHGKLAINSISEKKLPSLCMSV